MVCHLQVELSRRVRTDGGARCHGRTYHRFAMGPTLRSRLQENRAGKRRVRYLTTSRWGDGERFAMFACEPE
jgi:hypothetical protein